MTEPSVYLEKMSAFSRMLRREGLSVGPQETADACRVMTVLGFEDRERMKTALRTVFAKSREEQAVFDRVFDGFFISEDNMRRQAEEFMEREREIAQARQQSRQDLQLNGQPMDFTDDQREAYVSLPDKDKEKLRNFIFC